MSNTGKKTTSGGMSSQVSFSFDYGCADFYMLDTRTQRGYREPGNSSIGQLFPPEQASALKTWLLQTKAFFKFIVSPSMLLPRRLDMLNSAQDAVARSDNWQGYPADRDDLLVFIATNQIKNVTFLSGDEHLSCIANATLQDMAANGSMSTRIASIHASGLYAPFPFANAHPGDFVYGIDNFKVGNYACASSVRFAPAGSAFACIKVDRTSEQSPTLSVSFSGGGNATETLKVFPDEAAT